MIELRGERVKSHENPMKAVVVKEVEGLTREIGEMIPFWPETISTAEIAKQLGITPTAVLRRLISAQDHFKIFQHGVRYSRLKPDYSNIDEKASKQDRSEK